MPLPKPIKYRILVAAPMDVASARQMVLEIVKDRNLANAKRGITIEAEKWETVAARGGVTNPAALMAQLADEFSVMVGVYWSRIGSTPSTPRGSLPAIEEFEARGKPVLLYLCGSPPPEDAEAVQYQQVRDFGVKHRGRFWQFASTADLRQQFSRHLDAAIDDMRRGLHSRAGSFGRLSAEADRRPSTDEPKSGGSSGAR